MSRLLGLDVSTTATKAVLLDEEGKTVGVASDPYDFDVPRPGWTEQAPELWWDAACAAIARVLHETGTPAEEVAGVGLTGQMHGLVVLDRDGAVLRPAILWNDQRTAAECDEIRERVGRDRLIEITGNDALTGFTAPKLQWMRRHEPELYARVAHVLLPKDWVRWRLTGDYATDRAGAAGTLWLDLARRDWAPEILDALDVSPDVLPPTHEGPDVTGTISTAAAAATGLAPGTPVVAGAGDQAASAVGTGAVGEGVVSLSLGTSGVVFAGTERPVVEPEGRLHAFCHAAPGHWHLMGVMLSAAGSLRWLRDAVFPGAGYDELTAEAAKVPPGAAGLFFLPYLTGERTPWPDPDARGAFIGLSVEHRRGHLVRAVLEGVAFGLRDVFDLLRETGLGDVGEVRATGGGTKSPLWRGMIADVLGCDVVTVDATEGAAAGAAILAGVGIGWWPDVSTACAAVVRLAEPTPVTERRAAYDAAHDRYRRLYPALRGWF